ncbi:MAG TPA: heavy-metal-associated domain-containing protein [Bacillota bacterium]|nr:heavy-metal-associated domain-containing protein [Bacillota bacterium]
MKNLQLRLETLSCPSCVKRIEGALNKTKGIEKARVLFNSSQVKAQFDESIIQADDVAAIVEKLGFLVINQRVA